MSAFTIKNWAHHGVWAVNDLLDEHGDILTYENLEIMYNFKPMFLQFYWLTLALKKWLQDIGINSEKEKKNQAIIPFNINIFFKSEKGSKDMYTILNQGILPTDFVAEKMGRYS